MVGGESFVGGTPSPSLLFCYTRVQSFVAFLLQRLSELMQESPSDYNHVVFR